MQFDEVLRTFATFFEREGIRYALAGGNAVLAWDATDTLGHVDLLYVYGETADAMFAAAEIRMAVGVSLPVLRPEHLIAMKVHAMKRSPMRVLIDVPDIRYLLTLPGIDRTRVREYFSQKGLLKIYDELEKEIR